MKNLIKFVFADLNLLILFFSLSFIAIGVIFINLQVPANKDFIIDFYGYFFIAIGFAISFLLIALSQDQK